jgi:hypothetical protein
MQQSMRQIVRVFPTIDPELFQDPKLRTSASENSEEISTTFPSNNTETSSKKEEQPIPQNTNERRKNRLTIS